MRQGEGSACCFCKISVPRESGFPPEPSVDLPYCTVFLPSCRRLTDRQRALMLSYAEDETDVEGTVNGIASTTTGELCSCQILAALRL